jgi:uncharacterized HhH-GPD family protein
MDGLIGGVARVGDDPLIDAIAEGVERAPDVLVLRAHLAQMLFDKSRYAEALIQCGVTLQRDPDNLWALQLVERCAVALTSQARCAAIKRGTDNRASAAEPAESEPSRAAVVAQGRHSAPSTDSPQPPERTVDIVEAEPYRSTKPTAPITWDEDDTPAAEQESAASTSEGGVSENHKAVVAALIEFTESAMDDVATRPPTFTSSPEADRLLLDNPFAFLIAVLFDQTIPVERAWRAPYDLNSRLGHLDPRRIVDDPGSVQRAIDMPPKLHHFAENISTWVVSAATIVCDEYNGDASAIWHDNPTALDVQDRFEKLPGIGREKAAMAVQVLGRNCGAPIRDMPGSDAAYDLNVRRVLLRTGLAFIDELGHMRAVVSNADPTNGAGIALPAWKVGRTWCRAGVQDCDACPITGICPKHIGSMAAEPVREQWVDGDCA